ncbi:MAG TPA: hypothetical protein VEN79_09825 [Terriglobia bacterium]|nr:hypothetical protein [Terriglobia bacterium]
MSDDTFIGIYNSLYAGLSVAVVTNGFMEVLSSDFVNARAARRYANDAALGLAIQEVVDFTQLGRNREVLEAGGSG